MAVEQSSVPAKQISTGTLWFSGRAHSDAEISSPTSILDAKLSLNSRKERTMNPNRSSNSGVGLAALINTLNDDEDDGDDTEETTPISQPRNVRKVLFGSKLKVQIPPLPSSHKDFGIKTPRNAQNRPCRARESPSKTDDHLSLRDMELSEDYTCVITHGPTPRTTHLFDDCIVESCCGVVRLSELRKDSSGVRAHQSSSPPVSCCQTCNFKRGDDGDGSYIHRERRCKKMKEKAEEERRKKMLLAQVKAEEEEKKKKEEAGSEG